MEVCSWFLSVGGQFILVFLSQVLRYFYNFLFWKLFCFCFFKGYCNLDIFRVFIICRFCLGFGEVEMIKIQSLFIRSFQQVISIMQGRRFKVRGVFRYCGVLRGLGLVLVDRGICEGWGLGQVFCRRVEFVKLSRYKLGKREERRDLGRGDSMS